MTYIKTEFEKKMKNLGFSYKCNTDGVYSLFQNNDTNSFINAQLIYSEPIEEVIHLSNNGNEIQTKACFKLNCLNEVKEPYFLILAFQNTSTNSVEFTIIPKNEIIKRFNNENRISTDNKKIEMIFWLMPDNHLYETTNIGVEAEWYYLSKGVNGRMSDGTERDYSEFLNCWDRLKTV